MIFVLVVTLALIGFIWAWLSHMGDHRIFDDWDNPSAWKDEE